MSMDEMIMGNVKGDAVTDSAAPLSSIKLHCFFWVIALILQPTTPLFWFPLSALIVMFLMVGSCFFFWRSIIIPLTANCPAPKGRQQPASEQK